MEKEFKQWRKSHKTMPTYGGLQHLYMTPSDNVIHVLHMHGA